jgi:hypothetical protein
MSDLLTRHLSRDKQATERHRAFASYFGIQTSPGIDKRVLFDQIAEHLQGPDRAEDLAAWFVYRLCRKMVQGGVDHPLATGPESPAVRELARVLTKDARVMKSIRRYGGRDLIWFGEYTAPDGSWHTGGSNQTIAYRRAMPLVRQRFGFDRSPRDGFSFAKAKPVNRYRVRNGIAWLIVIACILGAIVCAR